MNNLNEFLDILVDTYGNNKIFNYQDLVLLAIKFIKNDNQIKKRGRPKKTKELQKSYWELIMHKYSCIEPTKYNNIHLDSNKLHIHSGIIGMKNNIEKIEFSNLDDGYNIIKKKILELKKEEFEIRYKSDKILI